MLGRRVKRPAGSFVPRSPLHFLLLVRSCRLDGRTILSSIFLGECDPPHQEGGDLVHSMPFLEGMGRLGSAGSVKSSGFRNSIGTALWPGRQRFSSSY
jgi:hypothetical protein